MTERALTDKEYLSGGKAGMAAYHRANPASFAVDLSAMLTFAKMDIRDGNDEAAITRISEAQELLESAFLKTSEN